MRMDSQMVTISRRTLMGAAGATLAGLGLAACTGEPAGTGSAGSASGSAPAAGEVVTTMRVGALQGPTGMGLIGLMDGTGAVEELAAANGTELTEDSPVGKNPAGLDALANSYEFTLAGSADELAPQLIQGDLDVLCVPANLAATLYQKTEGALTVLCVNTLGVLDIVEAGDTVHEIADLAGRTIYSAGRGSTPQYALEYLLRENGVDPEADVTIQWVSEHAECLAALQTDPSIVCMLPQPFATSALAQVEGARIALDLTEAWNETAQANGSDSQLITGVAVARRAFTDEFPSTVSEFLDAYAASVDFVNDDPATAAQLIGAAGIIAAPVAEKAIPYCNIVCMTGDEMRSGLEGYLETLYDADPESVGGALPADDFYYEA
ncbi:ABC transporter substrate-binding protein [Enorma burkinafasonensis]|uniref:ABC transporter substrate-binding protein n=1 Tax=Enorma burkinafasonensis TaxID=2590867 RepID=UPI001C969D90|nr:ABC transporter substrate-binding protein [Enorma burkinafasonensis]